jgi:hypothetical protein
MNTITNQDDNAWDTGELGRNAEFVKVAPEDHNSEAFIDDALGLQPISIRLEKSLIEDFKLIAGLSGIGYQPLMRQALKRFADCEKKRILREAHANAQVKQPSQHAVSKTRPRKAA